MEKCKASMKKSLTMFNLQDKEFILTPAFSYLEGRTPLTVDIKGNVVKETLNTKANEGTSSNIVNVEENESDKNSSDAEDTNTNADDDTDSGEEKGSDCSMEETADATADTEATLNDSLNQMALHTPQRPTDDSQVKQQHTMPIDLTISYTGTRRQELTRENKEGGTSTTQPNRIVLNIPPFKIYIIS